MKKINYKIIVMIIALIIFQVFSYYVAKLTPFDAHILTSNIDLKIPFLSGFIYFYIMWYILLFTLPLFMYIKDEEGLCKYFVSSFICLIISTLIFIFYPTIVIRPEIITNNFTNNIVSLIYLIDNPAMNCLPSGHCIICFLYIFTFFKNKNINISIRISVEIISILIILSTLFTKQHVIIDVLTALVISLSTYIIVNKTKIYKVLAKIF